MAFQEIIYAVEDGIATITMNRPDKLNAFTETMRREMIEAFDKADDDDNVRVVIVTGAGRGFCAGADLSRGGDTFDVEKRQTITDANGQFVVERLVAGEYEYLVVANDDLVSSKEALVGPDEDPIEIELPPAPEAPTLSPRPRGYQAPGVNMIGYATVTTPPSGAGKLRL